MTKTLLLSAGLLFGIGASAQYQITAASLPKIGDANAYAVDTMPTVTEGTSGANQTWDFSTLRLAFDTTAYWSDPKTANNGTAFPEAELEMNGAFFDVTATKMELIGVSFGAFGEPQPFRYSNTETIARIPSKFGDTYKDSSKFVASFYVGQTVGGFQVDSGRITTEKRITRLFDATGTMTTNYGVFTNCLRQRDSVWTKTSFEALVVLPIIGPSWQPADQFGFPNTEESTIEYSWYSAASPNAIASLTNNGTDDQALQATVNTEEPDGISERAVNTKGSVFPNPANNELFVKSVAAIQSVKIADLQGRVVLADNSGANKLDVASLTSGNYIISIISANGVTTEQLSIIK